MKSLAALLFFVSFNASALEWICNIGGKKVSKVDLIQAYSGQPVLINGAWMVVYMLPAKNPETGLAFGELGLSPDAIEKMAKNSSLVDRSVRIVPSPNQMNDKVRATNPSAGYSVLFVGGDDVVSKCF